MVALESSYSNQVEAMAGDTLAPAKVTNAWFTVEQGVVHLAWDPVTTNTDASALEDLAGYNIYRKDGDGGEYSLLTAVGAAVTTYDDTTALDGANWQYAVAAFDDEVTANIGAMSDTITVKTIPSVPQNLAANASDGSVILNWTSIKDGEQPKLNQNLAGYNIYRSETDGSGYAQIGTANPDVNLYTDNTVVNGTTYYYVITAFDNTL